MYTNEMTIAYLAIGVRTKLDQLDENDRKHYGGEIEIIGRVIDQAEFLDEFWSANEEALSEVWFDEDVIEPFGAAFVASKGEESPEEILKDVLKGALTEKAFNSIYKND